MLTDEYRVVFTRTFTEDLNHVLKYIAGALQNPDAAQKLFNRIEAAVVKRSQFPTAFAVYERSTEGTQDYYRIYVDNYTVFYVVIGDTMEVRRLLYSRQDFEKQIK